MNYSDNQTFLSQYTGDSSYLTSPDWLSQLPAFIFSAENRILRDLDLLATRVTDNTGAITANSRIFVLPTDTGIFQLVETLALIDENGIRHRPMWPVSKEVLDAMYPDEHAIGDPSIPHYWAPYTASEVLIGPAPGMSSVPENQGWPTLSVYGVQFPATLSEDNTTTFISTNLPDLMLAAEMIDVSAWCKNFGAMSDNPAQARDWNQEYERLLSLARPWELRRKLQASGWSSRLPNPINEAPRSGRPAA